MKTKRKTMKTKRKIGPITLWIVGHPQNPLIHGDDSTGMRAAFYRRAEAIRFREKHPGTFYRVFKATITRSNYEGDLEILRRELRSVREDAASSEVARQNAVERMEKAETELAALQQRIHDGNIWNTENPRFTPRTKSALALAAKEAGAQGATYVGTEHVLLGLLKQGEGVAHRHFIASEMTYEKAAYAMRVGRCL
jgi:ATP-dependent Clp protease ATP-binding subunit ClpA